VNNEEMKTDAGRQSVRAVERALQLLNCFSFDKKELTLGELSSGSGLPKPTVFRLLVPLEASGFIEKDARTQTYRLGIAVFQLGQIVQASLELRRVALPVMEELGEKTGETINLNIVRGRERVCIEKVDGKHDLRRFVELGKGLPLYGGASGKLLLAFLPDRQRREILADVGPSAGLAEQLEQIRQTGYAVSHDERVLGAAAVSAPILDHEGKLLAGLTISGASVRFTPDKVADFVELAVWGAKKISAAMGFRISGRAYGENGG